MVARSPSEKGVVAVAAACVLLGLACGGGGAQVAVPKDGGLDAAKPVDASADRDATIPDTGEEDVAQAPDVAETGDATPEAGPPDARLEAVAERPPVDVAPDVTPPKVDAGVDLKPDLPMEKPPATASWTIAPGATCTAAGVGCMDTGAIGGYQVTASGVCGAASSVQLWFPGGQSAVAAGTYTVKAASGILDVVNMQAGMVGVLAERDEGAKHARYWGRSGTALVVVSGAGRRITLSGVSLREETSAAMTTLGLDGTCP